MENHPQRRDQRELLGFLRELLGIAQCLQGRWAVLPARAGQSHPGSEAGAASGSAPPLPSYEVALEACWLRGRLQASQLRSSGSWKLGCEQIVEFTQAFFVFLTKANTSLGASRGAALMPYLKQFLRRQIAQCILTGLKDT